MKDFCVLGAGIAGSTIANLISKNYSVDVFDKARGPGGRSSSRRFKDKLSFDHGLQYVSPKNKDFKKFINILKKKNILKVWKGIHLDFNKKKNFKKKKFIGKIKNNNISKFLLKKINTKFNSTIKKIDFKKKYWLITLENNRKIKYKNIILTCPYPQVKALAKKYLYEKSLFNNVKMIPNITVIVAFKNSFCGNISSIQFNEDEIVSWAANENSKKRFKTNLCLWTIQANFIWSKKYINKYKNNKSKIKNILIKKFITKTGFANKNKVYSDIHGWKYAYNLKKTKIKSFWSKKYKLGICGDWFIGPKAEHAWLSANNLYKKII
ncbi:MAG: NAD(P)-binding protein [Pelagibacteraceae bacterium]